MRWVGWLLVGATAAGTGCATKKAPPVSRALAPATRPSDDPAWLKLEEIQPVPTLPASTTQPAPAAPLEALQIYAQARAAQVSGERAKAIVLLRQALEKDPDSFDLNYALGLALLGNAGSAEAAVEKLQRAAEIDPDDLNVHLQLGRQYLLKNSLPKAIEHLRLAMLTSQYKAHPESAAMVNLFLARALQQKGYHAAALEQYEILLRRLESRFNARAHPELYYFFGHRDAIYVQAGELNEKLGRFEQAMDYYRRAIERNPKSFSYQSRLAMVLAEQKRFEEAGALAADLVTAQQASRESVNLLKEVYRRMGHPGAVLEEVRRIVAQRPKDRALLFALADMLCEEQKQTEAQKLLEAALQESGGQVSVALRLFELHWGRQDIAQAARLVIETLARHPQAADDLEELWSRLVRDGGKSRLRAAALQALEVSAEAQASKLYWLARLESLSGHAAQARAHLEKVVAMDKPFVPAYRELLENYLQRLDGPAAQRQEVVEKLIDRARQQGQTALAHELSGIRLLSEKKPEAAAKAFAQAIEAGDRSAATQYALAVSLFSAGQGIEGERVLWKIITDHPGFGSAYRALYTLYEERAPRQAERVLQLWLAADPLSVGARLQQARNLALQNRSEEAEDLLLRLFREHPENPAVVLELRWYYNRVGRGQTTYFTRLEEARTRNPGNILVVEELVNRYAAQKRLDDALRIVQEMRQSAAGDPDQLYAVAQFYQRLNDLPRTHEVLLEILKADPMHAAANNDLGYMWAEEGKNLDQAEAMIRRAVEIDPNNSAYLDSLGWALYMRGRYAEARKYLGQAVESAEQPDPIVLDHLGDALYRVKEPSEALRIWQRSLESIEKLKGPMLERQDIQKLKLILKQKIEEHRRGRPVRVAEPAEEKVSRH